MAKSHILGFPRLGLMRDMKKAVEAYWRKELSQTDLAAKGREIEQFNWRVQNDAALSYVTAGDFTWYDHVLDTSLLFNIIPERFRQTNYENNLLDTFFCMARGKAPNGFDAPACEMTKWFDTNYHYIVPEFTADLTLKLNAEKLLNSIKAAQQTNAQVKPVLVGPATLLYLGKAKDAAFDKLSLLPKLLPLYQQVLAECAKLGVEWVQIDEPILVLDLAPEWRQALQTAYDYLANAPVKLLLATYFGELRDNLNLAAKLPVAGLHVDACRGRQALQQVHQALAADKVLSVGIIDGRNIWRANLRECFDALQPIHQARGENLWVSASCSLLHVPVDLNSEKALDAELKSWLAFATQKVAEIATLTRGLNEGAAAIANELQQSDAAAQSRRESTRIHNPAVKARVAKIDASLARRQNAFAARAKAQHAALKLPLLPTTTIGSFPQTQEIRRLRRAFKNNEINQAQYETGIKQEIEHVVRFQEKLDIDVLVHGEAERNDMVEYFGEQLAGFAFTQFGWVQSYGSRCVKPPIIFGDVSRPQAMTVAWSQYAQSLTQRLMKGMLTGPVTILAWSFVRDDQPEEITTQQIALALRDEVCDLEKGGIRVIQIDEPAFRELLPLRRNDWNNYLQWAAECFRISASGVQDETQIHTHMCYSEFNDIIQAIASLDADVITLESSRSDMELLEAFESFAYPNEIGPGVYDIHSPRVPRTEDMVDLLDKALAYVPARQLWVNPDCGLKTRGWPEVEEALRHMVAAAKAVRQRVAQEVTETA